MGQGSAGCFYANTAVIRSRKSQISYNSELHSSIRNFMSDIQLFRLHDSGVQELTSATVNLERHLQVLVENHMEALLGVRFLASEYTTGKTHRGRIDSLGLDENNCPVIVEYKRHSHENVINQGLYYLDWLLDHQADFRWLVLERLGKDAADNMEWSGTRLLCIAADFTKYDLHAVQQIARNIELIRYRQFGDELLLLELVNTQTVNEAVKKTADAAASDDSSMAHKTVSRDKTFAEQMAGASGEIVGLYRQLRLFILSLGDDVSEKTLKLYTAFRKLRNFATVVAYGNKLLLYLHIEPAAVTFSETFSRDVSHIGHWGTGNVEFTLKTVDDLERIKPLLLHAYQEG